MEKNPENFAGTLKKWWPTQVPGKRLGGGEQGPMRHTRAQNLEATSGQQWGGLHFPGVEFLLQPREDVPRVDVNSDKKSSYGCSALVLVKRFLLDHFYGSFSPILPECVDIKRGKSKDSCWV